MRRKELLRNNYEASRIDYVGAFIRLWVSFNTWYNDNSSSEKEKLRVLDAATASRLSNPYWKDMRLLNEPAHNDNYQHIIETVEGLSTSTYSDQNGHPVTRTTDSTGFRYRLRCNRENVHSRFLKACSDDSLLSAWCQGLVFFNTETRRDELFGRIYMTGYKASMQQRMWERFDAFEHIPQLLSEMDIQQYGSVLFHSLKNPSKRATRIGKLEDIYDGGFVAMLNRANTITSLTQAKKKYPSAGKTGKTYRWVEARGFDLMERELLLLYKLRSSIVHGDRDPSRDDVQIIARSAYEALDSLVRPLFNQR